MLDVAIMMAVMFRIELIPDGFACNQGYNVAWKRKVVSILAQDLLTNSILKIQAK